MNLVTPESASHPGLARVLIVDDEEPIRRNFRSGLEDLGYEVGVAANGQEGLQTFASTHFDIVLVDLCMPVMDGMELTVALKEKSPHTPIVIISGSGTVHDAVKAIRQGAWDYVVKPIAETDELDLVLRRNLDRAELLAENRRYQSHLEELVNQRTEELRESERKTRAIFDLSYGFIGLMTPEGILIDANRSALEFAGVQPSDVLGKPFWETPWWTHSKPMQEQLCAAIRKAAAGEVVRFEATHLAPDRVLHTIDFSLKPVKDESGRVMLLIPEGRDITERKRAEDEVRQLLAETERARSALLNILEDQKLADEALRKSEERLRLALTAAHMGTWEWIVATNQVHWSELVEPIFGLPKESFAGTFQAYLDLVHPEDGATVRRDIDAVLEGGSDAYSTEHRVLWPDKSIHWIEGKGRVYRDDAGQPLRMAGTVMDITGRKRVEEEIRRLNEELEHRVVERTAELTAANKELEAFSYSVSHDLSAPLRNISGFIGLLQGNAPRLDEESARYFDIIASEARRMGTLIKDLLELSRLGRTELRKSQVNLEQIVREVRENLALDTQGRKIAWTVESLPIVQADHSLLRQVMANLIGNAVKYTRNREQAEIQIGCLATPGAGSEWGFFIRDNGAGFNMQYADKLFGVFQRLHSAREFEGTGIGLANVHRIITRHSGSVWAEGEEGKGATFFFTLPKLTGPGQATNLT